MRGLAVVSAVLLLAGCQTPPAPHASTAPTDARSRLEDTLAKTPCDRVAAMELATMLLDSDPHAALDRTGTFLAACGHDVGMRTTRLRAHERLEQWDAALADANALVDHAPSEPADLILRAEIYVQLGQLDNAAEDYRDALSLNPADGRTALELAKIYERRGRVCEATKMLARAVEQQTTPEAKRPLQEKLAQLSSHASCTTKEVAVARGRGARATLPTDLTPKNGAVAADVAPTPSRRPSVAPAVAGQGQAIVHYTPGQVAQTTALLNGQVRLVVIVDTGATSVSISRRSAQRLGMDVDTLPVTQLSTAGGIRKGWRGKLAEVRVQNAVAQDVPCVIMEDKDIGEGGLLGQSFLSRFRTTLDSQRGEITINPR